MSEQMNLTGDYARRVPEQYYRPIEEGLGGRIEEVTYDSMVYALEGEAANAGAVTKRALVYLPKGYDESDRDYRVLYLMHGGGGDEEEYFYGQDKSHKLIHLLDHMIAGNELEPMIVVTPSFYYSSSQSALHDISEAGILTAYYHNEFRRDLMPSVEGRYRIRKDRNARAFGGFSMGGETTWEIFLHCLDLVRNFIPQSGDCWIVEPKGSADDAAGTVAAMKQKLEEQGFANLDYNIFATTGDLDIAYPALDPQMKEMFAAGWNSGASRLRYFSWSEGTHCYEYIYEYLYNALPSLF